MNLKSLMKRGIAAVALTVGLTTLGSVVSAPPAEASSTTCAMYGDIIRGVVRNGQVCSTVHGFGTYITSVTATFGTTIPGLNQICNPSIKLDIYDRYGRWITWRQGAQKTGCFPWAVNSVHGILVEWSFPAAKDGYARVSLQQYGNTVAEVRHRLK